MMKGRLVLVVGVYAALISTSAYAGNAKKITVTGILSPTANGNGTFLTASDGKEYMFDPLSKVGKKIWKVCDLEVPCTVSGTVDKNDMIVSVTNVKKGK